MKKQISGDKKIYDIFFLDEYAYLSTGFGIVVLNLEKFEIKFKPRPMPDNTVVLADAPQHIQDYVAQRGLDSTRLLYRKCLNLR